MAATGPHTYTCDGCGDDLDPNTMVQLRDKQTSTDLHFHGYDHVPAWAERRHSEHIATVAQAEADEADRLVVEAWSAFHPHLAAAAAVAPDPVAALRTVMDATSSEQVA